MDWHFRNHFIGVILGLCSVLLDKGNTAIVLGGRSRQHLPPGRVVSIGDELTLPCTVLNQRQDDSVSSFPGRTNVTVRRWLRKDSWIVVNGRISVADDGMLTVRNFSLADQGHYACAVSNSVGTLLSRRVKVIAGGLHKWSQEPQDAFARLGGIAQFQCIIENDPVLLRTNENQLDPHSAVASAQPAFAWYHNKLQLQGQSRILALSSGTVATLQILGVRETDVGTFSCSVRNDAGVARSREARLRIVQSSDAALLSGKMVHGNYRLVGVPRNQTLGIGETAVLECLAEDLRLVATAPTDASPIASIIWKSIDALGRLRLIARKPLPQISTNLVLGDVEEIDSGRYACVAGKDNAILGVATLLVVSPTTDEMLAQTPKDQTKSHGETVRFSCALSTSLSPEISWFKNGRRLVDAGSVKLFPPFNEPPSAIDESGGGGGAIGGYLKFRRDLVISTLGEQDAGVYQCFAGNGFGAEVTAAAVLKVKASGEDEDLRPWNLTAQPLYGSEPQQHQMILRWQQPPKWDRSAYEIPAYVVSYWEVDDGTENTEVAMDSCKGPRCVYTCCSTITLRPYTNYSFSVSAILRDRTTLSTNKMSHASERVTQLTSDDYALASQPLTVTSILSEPGSVLLSWSDEFAKGAVPGRVTGFAIDVRKSGEQTSVRLREPSTVTERQISGLSPGSKYYFRVIAVTGAGLSESLSSRAFVWTSHRLAATVGVPSVAVTVAKALSSTSVYLEWMPQNELLSSAPNDSSAKKTGVSNRSTFSEIISFSLAYGPVGGKLHEKTNLSLPSRERNITVDELVPDTIYEFSIAGVDISGIAGPETNRLVRTMSNQDDTLADGALLVEPPHKLKCETISSTALRISWLPPPAFPQHSAAGRNSSKSASALSANVVRYVVRWNAVPSSPTDQIQESDQIQYSEASSPAFNADGLKAGTSYQFAIKSLTQLGRAGPYSADVQCSTSEEVPSEPVALHAVAIPNEVGVVQISWLPPLIPNGIVLRYIVFYADAQSDTSSFYYQRIVDGSAQNVILRHLNPLTDYVFYVAAENNAGRGKASSHFKFSFRQAAAVPPAAKNPEIVRYSYTEGIVVGICLSLLVILCGVVLFMCRSKIKRKFQLLRSKCSNSAAPNTTTLTDSSLTQNAQEAETLLDGTGPILHRVESNQLDAKGGMIHRVAVPPCLEAFHNGHLSQGFSDLSQPLTVQVEPASASVYYPAAGTTLGPQAIDKASLLLQESPSAFVVPTRKEEISDEIFADDEKSPTDDGDERRPTSVSLSSYGGGGMPNGFRDLHRAPPRKFVSAYFQPRRPSCDVSSSDLFCSSHSPTDASSASSSLCGTHSHHVINGSSNGGSAAAPAGSSWIESSDEQQPCSTQSANRDGHLKTARCGSSAIGRGAALNGKSTQRRPTGRMLHDSGVEFEEETCSDETDGFLKDDVYKATTVPASQPCTTSGAVIANGHHRRTPLALHNGSPSANEPETIPSADANSGTENRRSALSWLRRQLSAARTEDRLSAAVAANDGCVNGKHTKFRNSVSALNGHGSLANGGSKLSANKLTNGS